MTLYYLLFYYFFPLLLLIFSIFLLGGPRIIITNVSNLLWIRVYRTSLPLITVTLILLLIPFLENFLTYIYDRIGFEDLITTQEVFETSAEIELQMRKIFYKERNMLILLCLMLMMFIFLIFSSSYNKTYYIEDEIEKYKQILKGEEKGFSKKKND